MFQQIIEKLKTQDKKSERVFRVYRGINTESWQEFSQFLIEYFELKKIRKMWDEQFESEGNLSIGNREFLWQESEELNYLEYILKEIKFYMPLIFKLSQDLALTNDLEKGKISFDGIFNMIENFTRVQRTGRKRNWNIPQDIGEKIKEFEVKYQNIIDYYESIKRDEIKPMNDFTRAIFITFKITKEQANQFIDDFRYFKNIKKAYSERSLYRYKAQRIISLREISFWVELIVENYDFYEKSVLPGIK